MSRYSTGLAVVVLLLFGGQVQASINGGGDGGGFMDDPPITVGADWYATTNTPPAFFWYESGWNAEGPFTFTSLLAIRLDVTDDFSKGDQFEVFDWDSSLGLTSAVPKVQGLELGPEVAFHDPTYSSGSFYLPAGSHSITLYAVSNPWGAGRGYLRVMPDSGVVPEPTSLAVWSVLSMVGVGYGWWRKRRH